MRKLLIASGILSSVLYGVMDVLISRRYKGYSYVSQAVSELNATGAPTRPLFIAFSIPYNMLLATFCWGLWMSPGRDPNARLAPTFLGASAAVGALTPLLFPMDIRGTPMTRRGRLHPPMTGLGSLFILLAMGFAAGLHGKRFRLYTVATVCTSLAFGVASSLYAPHLVAGKPTPGLGILERVSIYAYLLWVAVLAASSWSGEGMVDVDDANSIPRTTMPDASAAV